MDANFAFKGEWFVTNRILSGLVACMLAVWTGCSKPAPVEQAGTKAPADPTA